MKYMICKCCAGVLTTLAACSAMSAPEPANLLPNPGFEQGLESWATWGKASFKADQEVKHGGDQAARITVPADATLEYQQIAQSMPAKPGEHYTASFWMRCKGVADGAGAYGAIEFFHGGERIVYFQSQLTRAELWQPMSIEAVAPDTADRMRLVLICHAHGTAWFDDVALVTPAEQPLDLTFTLQPNRSITDNWQGFGCQGDMFLSREWTSADGITDTDRELITRRVSEMRPQIVRLHFQISDWEPERGKRTPECQAMRDLRATLAIYKKAGTDVHITEWGHNLPAWLEPRGRTPSAAHRQYYMESFVAAIKYLREECGFDNIRYATVWNEPNYMVEWDDYAPTCRALAKSLKDAGLGGEVALLGPDETGTFDWTARAVAELDDVIDYYDVHNYSSNTAIHFGSWVKPRVEIMPPVRASRLRPSRKRLMITEFGMQQGMSTFESKRNGDYDYGLFLADCAIEAAAQGASALMMWCLMDTNYGPQRMKWGLWRYKDDNWEPRPGFYSWSLITRYTERGSTVHPMASSVTDAAAVAFRSPKDGRWSLLTVNRRTTPRPFAIEGLPEGSVWEPFVYSRDAVPTADRKMIRSGPTQCAESVGRLHGTMPAQSFILWRQKRR